MCEQTGNIEAGQGSFVSLRAHATLARSIVFPTVPNPPHCRRWQLELVDQHHFRTWPI